MEIPGFNKKRGLKECMAELNGRLDAITVRELYEDHELKVELEKMQLKIQDFFSMINPKRRPFVLKELS